MTHEFEDGPRPAGGRRKSTGKGKEITTGVDIGSNSFQAVVLCTGNCTASDIHTA
jgi:hypothetical protein